MPPALARQLHQPGGAHDRPLDTLSATKPTSRDLIPEVGITSTPVIDVKTGTLYVVAETLQEIGRRDPYVQRLHALDIETGAEKIGGPAVIAETISAGRDQDPQYVSGPKVPRVRREWRRPRPGFLQRAAAEPAVRPGAGQRGGLRRLGLAQRLAPFPWLGGRL